MNVWPLLLRFSLCAAVTAAVTADVGLTRLCFPCTRPSSLCVCSKNKAVNLADTVGGTDLEKKVKGATSNEHYPTPLSQLQDIAQATHD